MAKLGSYYALCPLVDIKNIFGIAEDADRGVVTATLSKNIASRYKISDQKQISCWRTKDKFSSPVFYHKSQSKYVGVFNQSYIKLWDTDDNLDKVKKYKFNKPIHSLISDEDNIFVVFENGGILELDDALNQRKEVISECIEADQIDVIYKKFNGIFYVGIITKEEEYNLYWTTFSNRTNKYYKIILTREGLSLSGYAFHATNNTMNVLTFWSDGSVFSCNLDSGNEEQDIGELYTVIESISMKHKLSVLSLDENYIALYGADINEDGAILIIYNTQFKVTQTEQPFKLFTNSAKIWRIDTNLFLPVGQNLAVIPFYLETEQLAALVGSHKVLQDELDSDVKIVNQLEIVSWDAKYQFKKRNCITNYSHKIQDMTKQGLPESLIVEQLLPEIFEKNNINLLSWVLNYVYDVPEKYLVKILKYIMQSNGKLFDGEKYALDIIPSEFQPLEKMQLINCILNKSFSEELLLPYLRNELDLNDVLILLKYIYLIWYEKELAVPKLAIRDSKLLEWSCVLIDSNYQKIVLSKDDSTAAIFKDLKDLVTIHLTTLQDLSSLKPYLIALKNGTVLNKDTTVSLNYGIEQIALY